VKPYSNSDFELIKACVDEIRSHESHHYILIPDANAHRAPERFWLDDHKLAEGEVLGNDGWAAQCADCGTTICSSDGARVIKRGLWIECQCGAQYEIRAQTCAACHDDGAL
jgi:hypothetical protein